MPVASIALYLYFYLFTGIAAAIPRSMNSKLLQLPPNAIISAHDLTNHTHHTLHDWPPQGTRFHVEGSLYFHIFRYGRALEPSTERQLLWYLDHIALKIETGGQPEDMLPWGRRQFGSVVYTFLGKGASRTEPLWLTRAQAGVIIDFVAGLTLLHGPRELLRAGIEDQALGKQADFAFYV